MKGFSLVVHGLAILGVMVVLSSCKSDSTGLPSLHGSSGSSGNGGNSGSGGDGGGGDGGDDGDGGSDGGTIDGGNGGPGGDGGVIAFFKPALAVRGTGCIMCHAAVQANIITDFGAGEDYAFGGGYPQSWGPFSGSIYGDHAENWRTGKVWGKVIVPQANVTYAQTTTTLANYLRSIVIAPDQNTPAPEVEEKGLVYIGAPTAARILQLGGTFPPEHPQWKYITQAIGVDVTGLEVAPGNQYIRNKSSEPLVCAGDLIVDGTLFLHNLQLQTTSAGCRIYATKSVFIQGPITYLGTAMNRNLQITSARAILMGMGPTTLRDRIITHWTRVKFFTRDNSLSVQEKLDLVYNEALYIPDLVDAASQQPHGRNLGFDRIFLNAPMYHSRYQGEFKGVIVAEYALASLNAFAFHFDSVFEAVPILPLLQAAEYLRVE